MDSSESTGPRKQSRRNALGSPLKLIISMLDEAAKSGDPADGPALSGRKMSRREFGMTTAVAGAALTVLPHMALNGAGATAAQQATAAVVDHAATYMASLVEIQLQDMIKRRFVEMCSPDVKFIWTAAESQENLVNIISRVKKQGSDFASRVLADVEDREAYAGTAYTTDRGLRHAYKTRRDFYSDMGDRLPQANAPELSDETLGKYINDTKSESMQFLRNEFNNVPQKEESRAAAREQFDPLAFAIGACNIGINWNPAKKRLMLTRPEFEGLFPGYTLTKTDDGPIEAGNDLSATEKFAMREELMTQVKALIYSQYPDVRGRVIRDSCSGIIIKNPPMALLARLEINPALPEHAATREPRQIS
jgi:hypothetical protein